MEYYFATREIDFDGQILEPRIPEHRMNSEDGSIPRICVSQSVDGCLTALGWFKPGDIVFIHTCTSDNVMQPTLEQVPDRFITGEEWILEPVKMKLFMKLWISGMMGTVLGEMDHTTYSYMLNEETEKADA